MYACIPVRRGAKESEKNTVYDELIIIITVSLLSCLSSKELKAAYMVPHYSFNLTTILCDVG